MLRVRFALALLVTVGMAGVGCSVDSTGIGMLAPGPDGAAGSGGVGGGTGGSGGAGGTGASGGVGGAGGGGKLDAMPDAGKDAPDPVDELPPREINGSPCTGPQVCASGYCVDGICCESPCSGICVACASAKTGQRDGACRPIPADSDPDNECTADGTVCGRKDVCNGNGSCAVAPAGAECGDSACSGNVVTPSPRCDGVGACEATADRVCPGNLRCANAQTCRTSCTGEGDCIAGSHCDTGTGKCGDLLPLGAACNSANAGLDCLSGHCADGVCCDKACTGTCRACTMARTGVANGVCAPALAGTDPDDDCDADDPSSCGNDGTCDGAGACRQYADGTVCATGCCGGGGAGRVCQYSCRLGSCDMNTPTQRENCGGGTCCCENNGGAACVLNALCGIQGGTCGG